MLRSRKRCLEKGTIKIVHNESSEITISASESFSCSPSNDELVFGDEEIISYEFKNTGKNYAVGRAAKKLI